MKDQTNNALKSIQQFWKSREKKQKITYISVFAGIIIVAIVISLILNHTNYSVLYTSVEQGEASEILTEIQAMGIDAQVKSDGTVLVPEDQEDSIRIKLAAKGYPKSGFSYDLWTDNVGMFTTDSQKREIAKMALQERIQATLKTFSGVNEAYVTLVIPETSNTVISTNKKESSAAVVVHLNSGATLSSNQIKGIVRIVMKSVPDLTEENVTLTDGTGKLLLAGDNSTDSLLLENQRLQFKQDFQQQMQDAVIELLGDTYGKNGIKVIVNAEFDYDKKVGEITTYTPSVDSSGMVAHQDESSATGTDGTSSGVVGVESNADGYPTVDETTSGAGWTETSKSTTYLVNTLKEQTEKNGVYVEKVSVSVLLNKETLADNEKETVTSLVANATGTTPELITVANLPGIGTETEPGVIPGLSDELYFGYTLQQIITFAIIAFVGILFVFIVMVTIIRKSGKKKKKGKQLAYAGATGEHDEMQGQPVDIKKLSEKAPETKEAAIRREIGDFAKNSPEIAAQLLKSWIREEGD